MARFRKKPVVIQAFQFVRKNFTPDDFPEWFKAAAKKDEVAAIGMDQIDFIAIHTLEGTMRADVGDWIIRGVKGELYPIKDEIFKATYDEVADV